MMVEEEIKGSDFVICLSNEASGIFKFQVLLSFCFHWLRSRWVITSHFTFISIFLPQQISFSVLLRISTCSFKKVFVYVSGWVYVVCVFVPNECMHPWRPEECDRTPEAWVPGSCELTITTGPLGEKYTHLIAKSSL